MTVSILYLVDVYNYNQWSTRGMGSGESGSRNRLGSNISGTGGSAKTSGRGKKCHQCRKEQYSTSKKRSKGVSVVRFAPDLPVTSLQVELV